MYPLISRVSSSDTKFDQEDQPRQVFWMPWGWMGEWVKRAPPPSKNDAYIVGKPQGREDRCHRSGEAGGEVIFGDHQRHFLGNAVVSPDLENVLHQCRFL